MAKFCRNENGIGWLEVTWIDLAKYSGNMNPICDECLKSLKTYRVVLIPILNQAYCPECGEKVLARIRNYPEDRSIAARCEQFWLNYFGIKEV